MSKFVLHYRKRNLIEILFGKILVLLIQNAWETAKTFDL